MASALYLTLLIGPVQPIPAPKVLMDALTGAEVTVSATGKSGFQLSFTLANSSPLQLFFLLTMGAPIPLIRVILVAALGGLPQVIMDGVVKHHEVVPDAMQGSSKLVITGEDLTAVMDLTDSSGTPYPGLSPDSLSTPLSGSRPMFRRSSLRTSTRRRSGRQARRAQTSPTFSNWRRRRAMSFSCCPARCPA
jgi:hypothetical protein